MNLLNHFLAPKDSKLIPCPRDNRLLINRNTSSSKFSAQQKSYEDMTYKSDAPLPSPNESIKKKKDKDISLSKTEINSTRKKFTEEEDRYLTQLVDEMGPKNWESIAEKMPNRTARQCRDRYSNYLIPGFFNGEWSAEEDENLYIKYQEIGPRWTIIQEYFKNRSPNSIKNRWNYFVSRKEFKINFEQNHQSNNYDMMNYQQHPQKPNFVLPSYNCNNLQLIQNYFYYNQHPVNFVPNTYNIFQADQSSIKNEKKQNNSSVNLNNSITSISHIHFKDNMKVGKNIKSIDQKIKEFADVDDSTESIFQLNIDQNDPGMIDEEIDDYDNNVYCFDDSELFSF